MFPFWEAPQDGPSEQDMEPAGQCPSSWGAPKEQRGRHPLRCSRNRSHKEVGQQLPMTPPLVGNCPAKGLRHLVSRSRFSSDSLDDLTQVA